MTDYTVPLWELRALHNTRYTLEVWPYFAGQYRLKLTDRTRPDPFARAPHGTIVREL